MPIYCYECPECKKRFEKIVPHFDTDKKEKCPECGRLSSFVLPTGEKSSVRFLFNYFAPDV